MPTCPSCGNEAETLLPVDTAKRVALQSTGQEVYAEVCPNCLGELSGKVSQGMKLRMERDAREKNKMVMWKNRVNLIKQGRNLMSQRAYAEAAITYEKYLRILELVYNLRKGELSPAVFSNSTRSKEMTVIASVYWDLMRIYDTSPNYGDRMGRAAEQLAKFLPYSTLYPDVIKKADLFARSARNPQIVRRFLKTTKSVRGPCFLASAVFEAEPYSWELYVLRRYRDEVLKTKPWGRKFVFYYYRYSPALAGRIRSSQWKKKLLRPIFKKIAVQANKSLKSS